MTHTLSQSAAWPIPALLSLLVLACGSQSGDGRVRTSDSTARAADVPAVRDSVVIELEGRDSLTVFELLRRARQVEYRSTTMGVFVTAIDSIENGNNAYWIYSVNDSTPSVASDRFVTRGGDTVRWHFRKAE
jgi:hypothetical protein